MTRPVATVGVDVDPVDVHLAGYGHVGAPPDPLVYDVALPRLAAALARAGVRATLFCLGRDAAAHAGALAALAAAGHEIASHSQSHPMPFSALPPERQRAELEDSKRALERACGRPVVGFRAPNFDMDAALVPRLAAAGYRYDASAYPTWLLPAARLVLALRSRDRSRVLGLRAWPVSWRREPYVWRVHGASLHEFPLAVTAVARLPVYHTLRYATGERRFAARLDDFARRGETLGYALHAVDALGLAEDGVDPRLARHPGMDRPLAAKLELLDRTLGALAERFEVRPFAERLPAAD